MPRLAQIHESDGLDYTEKLNKAMQTRLRSAVIFSLFEKEKLNVVSGGDSSIDYNAVQSSNPVASKPLLTTTGRVAREVFFGKNSKRSAKGVSSSIGVDQNIVKSIFLKLSSHGAWKAQEKNQDIWIERNTGFNYDAFIAGETLKSAPSSYVGTQSLQGSGQTGSISFDTLIGLGEIMAKSKKVIEQAKKDSSTIKVLPDEEDEEVVA